MVKRIQVVLPIFVVVLVLPLMILGMGEPKAQDQTVEGASAEKGSASWVDTPGGAVGGKAIFTDCRQQAVADGRRPPVQLSGMKRRESAMPPGVGMKGMPAQGSDAAMMEPLGATPPPAPSKETPQAPDTVPPSKPDAPEGNTIYLSNDDSMSLSSAQRIEYAIRHFLPIPTQHLRPHEFLNYYQFAGAPVEKGRAFSVAASLTPGIKRGQTSLAFSVKGRQVSKAERRPAVMTFVVDQSGSMNASNKMDYLKRGLKKVWDAFKPGDVVSIVQFNHQVCTPLEGFVVGRDSRDLFDKAVEYLQPWGSTNLHDGMVRGYDLGEKYYEKVKNNRVIMVTDALANTGVVNDELSSTVTRFYDKRRIAFSGIGVGHDFNDRMLDQLTEKGKGAYLFLASESAVDKVFGDKFVSLLEVVARDVHFRMTLPPSLAMDVFYGEESSTRKEDVQAIHYFANSGQLFLSELKGEAKDQDSIRFVAEYTDPKSGEKREESFKWVVGDIRVNPSATIDKARLILSLTDLIGETSPATVQTWSCWVHPCYKKIFPIPLPPGPPRPDFPCYEPIDPERGRKACAYYRNNMNELAGRLKGDVEVEHIQGLTERYCGRFEEGKK